MWSDWHPELSGLLREDLWASRHRRFRRRGRLRRGRPHDRVSRHRGPDDNRAGKSLDLSREGYSRWSTRPAGTASSTTARSTTSRAASRARASRIPLPHTLRGPQVDGPRDRGAPATPRPPPLELMFSVESRQFIREGRAKLILRDGFVDPQRVRERADKMGFETPWAGQRGRSLPSRKTS
jgi:hypothetical protein